MKFFFVLFLTIFYVPTFQAQEVNCSFKLSELLNLARGDKSGNYYLVCNSSNNGIIYHSKQSSFWWAGRCANINEQLCKFNNKSISDFFPSSTSRNERFRLEDLPDSRQKIARLLTSIEGCKGGTCNAVIITNKSKDDFIIITSPNKIDEERIQDCLVYFYKNDVIQKMTIEEIESTQIIEKHFSRLIPLLYKQNNVVALGEKGLILKKSGQYILYNIEQEAKYLEEKTRLINKIKKNKEIGDIIIGEKKELLNSIQHPDYYRELIIISIYNRKYWEGSFHMRPSMILFN